MLYIDRFRKARPTVRETWKLGNLRSEISGCECFVFHLLLNVFFFIHNSCFFAVVEMCLIIDHGGLDSRNPLDIRIVKIEWISDLTIRHGGKLAC